MTSLGMSVGQRHQPDGKTEDEAACGFRRRGGVLTCGRLFELDGSFNLNDPFDVDISEQVTRIIRPVDKPDENRREK